MTYHKCRVDAGPNASPSNPHYGNEHQLMLTAGKPLAYLYLASEAAQFPEFTVEAFTEQGLTRYLVYPAEQAYRARMWHRVSDMYLRGLICANVAHVRRGFLLGYTKEQVRPFLRRGSPVS